jgi:hypothetical protein
MSSPKVVKPAPVKLPDPPPTIDQAAQNAEANDRLRKRKGRSAYIFGGNSGALSTTAVGTKTLTGQ